MIQQMLVTVYTEIFAAHTKYRACSQSAVFFPVERLWLKTWRISLWPDRYPRDKTMR